CTEPACETLAKDILASLDTTQDPCENFYDFATNGWRKSHPPPVDEGFWGTFEVLDQENKHILQQILDPSAGGNNTIVNASNLAQDQYDKETLQKLGDMYSSCINTTQLDTIGDAPLKSFVGTLRGLYRGNDTSSEMKAREGTGKSKGLTDALAFLHTQGVASLFSLYVNGDIGGDPKREVLWFTQPTFGLPSKEYFQDNTTTQLYQTVVQRFLTILQDGSNDTDIQGLAKQVVDFESTIAQASVSGPGLSNPISTYNPMNATAFFNLLPQVDFITYFSAAFNTSSPPDRVVVVSPAYYTALSQTLDGTPDQVIESYLVLQAGLTLAPFLGMGTDAWQVQQNLSTALSGTEAGAVGDRGKYCVGQVVNNFGYAAGRYFVNETFTGDSRQKVTKMIQNIVKAFTLSLENIDWIDDESAKAAAEKANKVAIKVGYPLSPNTTSSGAIAEYYSPIQVDKYNFFQNTLNAMKDGTIKLWNKAGKDRDPNEWFILSPPVVNAFYYAPANEITFPAGILQSPFFSRDWQVFSSDDGTYRPGYLTYGAVGTIAGHELTHAFDSNGRLYNQDGKLVQWWTNSTVQGYQTKLDCIVKEYSNYTIPDGKGGVLHVNGNTTATENIGDSGIIQSYRAWKTQYNSSLEAGNEYLLPGVNYTRNQLFWIAFARMWATTVNPATAALLLLVDPHSPYQWRVDGTLSNIREFAEAFNCPVGSKLNPPREDQCIFWG
ncbi:Endothelin-converting enzyme 1, partial [Leucoagaricus sp. SymC.cos]